MKWISVDQELPDIRTEVIVCYKKYADPVIFGRLEKTNNFGLQWYDDEGYLITPSHWMPKPVPPK
jgi:hypothetical protein